jgi:hypothetical protein
VGEHVHPAVLQVAVHEAPLADVLAEARLARHQAADAPHEELDPDAGFAGGVELGYQAAVFQGVQLENNVGSWPFLACLIS